MSKIITRLRQIDKMSLWLGCLLLALVLMMAFFALSLHLRNARRKVDPEVTSKAKNSFPRTIRVVGDKDYKPFSYLNGRSVPCGYDIELVIELANRLGYNLELELMSWNEAVKMIQANRVDLVLGCDWQDTAVMDCNFTIPTFEEKFVVFQERPLNVFTELYSKKIAVIEGCGLKATLEKYQLWKNCIEYDSVTDCAQAVLDSKCDCFIAHHTIGEICLREFGDRGKRLKGRMDFAGGQMCFGVTNDIPDLFAKVNEKLIEIRADGTLDALERKWIGHFVEDISLLNFLRKNPLTLFGILNFAAIVALVIVIMCFYLRRIKMERNRAIVAEQAKNLFFSTVSHDIRTPLNAIIGFSELLKHGIDDEAERNNALNAITTSSNTLLDLVNDILNLSKLETNKMVFNMELTDMSKLASGVLHSFDLAVDAENVKLVEEFDSMPFLFVDPYRIRQILFNLIGNAVKFTEKGEIRVKIGFDKYEEKADGFGQLIFSVSDTGHGISLEDQRKLMQPFVQVQGPNAQKGTGLGLYICRQLALRMGGELTLYSELGKGSTFTVILQKVGFSVTKPNAVNDKQEEAGVLPNKRVLVVDDMAVNRIVLQAMLKRLGITDITAAANGVEALKMLQDSPVGFDIIMTDMLMPVMDGKELLREIRRNDCWKALPVYAVTADAEVQDSCEELGFTGVLLKPITLDKLRKLLS
ncbi:MAG: transporter substrate-binding domain-containing protein [Victivallales bacterium]|nr:transporter substrate-binding domain-containing protein [Victivallales bacterium]